MHHFHLLVISYGVSSASRSWIQKSDSSHSTSRPRNCSSVRSGHSLCGETERESTWVNVICCFSQQDELHWKQSRGEVLMHLRRETHPQASSRLHVHITVDVMSIFFRLLISFLHPPRCNTPDSRPCRMNAWPMITEVVHIKSSLLRTSRGPCWKQPVETLPVGQTFCFSTDKPGSSQTAFCARVQGDIPTFKIHWRKNRTDIWLEGHLLLIL